jgi:hypothetical protein
MFDWPASKKIFRGGAAEATPDRTGRSKSKMVTRTGDEGWCIGSIPGERLTGGHDALS